MSGEILKKQAEFSLPRARCPRCGLEGCHRHSLGRRLVHDLDGLIEMTVSKHWCIKCSKHFVLGVIGFSKNRRYSDRLITEARRLRLSGLTLDKVRNVLKNRTGFLIAPSTLSDWMM